MDNIEEELSTNTSINENEFYNPYAIFYKSYEKSPNNISIVFKEKHYTVKQIIDFTHNFISYLESRNIPPHSSILYSASNHPLLLIAYLSTAFTNTTFIPINPLLSKKDKEYIINEIKPIIHITNQNLNKYYKKCFHQPNTTIEKHNTKNITSLPQRDNLNSKHSLDFFKIFKTNVCETTNFPNVILYTSGTSGKPKGVKLSYKNLWWGSKNLREGFKYDYNDKILVLAPMSHIGGFNGCTLDIFTNGGYVHIAQNLNPEKILEIIQEEKITLTFAVPTLYEKILTKHDYTNPEKSIKHLRLPLIGGSPVSKSLIEKAQKHKLNLLPVWGMTEISASGTYLEQKLLNTLPNNVGKPFPHIQIQILDLQTQKPITENGKIGEIAVNGPSVSQGYLNIPKTENFHNGYLLTNDLGCWYNNDFVQITGRKNDLIITGGEHVFPNEIDEILQTYPNIQSSKTFAIPDQYWGEKIISAVIFSETISEKENFVYKENTVTSIHTSPKEIIINEQNKTYENIKKFLSPKLSKYKIPKEIMVIKSMPLLPNGKIDIQTLKQKYSEIK